MVKVLIWLFETKDGHRILDVLQRVMSSYKTPQTQIQVTLCKFIQSKYKATDVAKKVFANDTEFILPVITEERFHDFIISISEVAFIELMDTFFIQAYNASANHSASTILSIISSYKFSTDKNYLALKAKADLYAFLAEGIIPTKMEASKTIEGMLLMALMEAYNGKAIQTGANSIQQQPQSRHHQQYPAIQYLQFLPHIVLQKGRQRGFYAHHSELLPTK